MSDEELILINQMVAKLGGVHQKLNEAITELRQAMEELEDALKSERK